MEQPKEPPKLTRANAIRNRVVIDHNTGVETGAVVRLSRNGGSRRRPSRKYKKSAKRVFRKKSRSTRRR